MPHIYVPVNVTLKAGDYFLCDPQEVLTEYITSDIWGTTRFDDGLLTVPKETILKIPSLYYAPNGKLIEPEPIKSTQDYTMAIAFAKDDKVIRETNIGQSVSCKHGAIAMIPTDLIKEQHSIYDDYSFERRFGHLGLRYTSKVDDIKFSQKEQEDIVLTTGTKKIIVY